jgi:hypothetical protein
MIAKRIAAVGTALVLVLGAYAIREGLIEGDGDEPADEPAAATTLVCPPELADICRSIDLPDRLDVRIEESGRTLDVLAGAGAEPVVWLTYEPFPAAVDQLRRSQGRDSLELAVEPMASSPLALVARSDDLGCGDPVDWRCLGDGGASIGFAGDPDSGIGLLGATAAANGYADRAAAPFGDALFEVWLRGVLTSVNRSQLSTGTAIATIQVRPSAMDVAVGAEVELSEERRDRFQVLYAGSMGDADVILAVPSGTSAPPGLGDALSGALVDAGWSSPTPSSSSAGSDDAAALLATRDFWRNL